VEVGIVLHRAVVEEDTVEVDILGAVGGHILEVHPVEDTPEVDLDNTTSSLNKKRSDKIFVESFKVPSFLSIEFLFYSGIMWLSGIKSLRLS